MSEEAKAEALEGEQPSPEVAEAAEPAASESREVVSPELLRQLRVIVPVVWLVGIGVAQFISGIQLAFLVLAGGVLVLVITLMWSSVQSLTGGSSLGFEEALGMGAPSKVEEEKRSVLRALKDLEYERSVGKITPEDYAELSARYRADAKRLIQSVDEALAPARQEVEKTLLQRLQRAGLADAAPPENPAETTPASASKLAEQPAAPTAADEDEAET